MISPQQTKDQERANAAWRCVEEAGRQSPDFKKRYGTLARRLPSLIQTNGLGQALAFLYSKAKFAEPEDRRSAEAKANGAIFTQVGDWVKKELNVATQDNLLRVLVREPTAFYRRATAEALAFALWLRRFAEAELPSEEGGE